MISERVVLADRAFAAGRLDESAHLCTAELVENPASFPANLLLGVIHVKKGQFADALPRLEYAETLDPAVGKASLWRSRALRGLGRVDEALAAAVRANKASPQDPGALYQLGICNLEARNDEDAVEAFRQLAAIDPGSAAVHHGLGLALKALGRNSEAIRSLRRATVLAPEKPQYLVSLFESLMDESDSVRAVDCARRLLEVSPGAESHLRLARALLLANRREEVANELSSAEQAGLPDGPASFAAGSVLSGLGRSEEALAHYRQSIEQSPDFGPPYAAIAYSRRMADADRSFVEGMLERFDKGGLSPSDGSYLGYALGKSFEDLGEYETAMAHYDEANRLAARAKFGHRKFASEHYARSITETIETYRDDAWNHSPDGSASDRPIFVVGMLRSGTTLVEQILSSHPDVGSAGEQGFWLHHREGLRDPGSIGRLAAQYDRMLEAMWPEKSRVVDKMPDNYLVAPFLRAAFPSARIVHVVRNAADTCLSIYTTINRLPIEWSHDQQSIAFVYRQYMRMMQAWRESLPPGSMLEVRYEELVTTREAVTRSMLEFCGLPWHDACLSPEKNARVVSTPSAWQVRQPVYTTSIDRWRRFAPHIGPFVGLLEAADPAKVF